MYQLWNLIIFLRHTLQRMCVVRHMAQCVCTIKCWTVLCCKDLLCYD